MPVKIKSNDAAKADNQPMSKLDQMLTGDIEEQAVKAITELAEGVTAETLEGPSVSDDENPVQVFPEVDELASLLEWEANLKHQLSKTDNAKRLKALKEKFQLLADTDPADDVVTFVGEAKLYEMGPKSNSRYIVPGGKEQIVQMLGAEQFIKLAEIKLGDIDNYLTLPQREQVLGVERGNRSGKVLDKTESGVP